MICNEPYLGVMHALKFAPPSLPFFFASFFCCEDDHGRAESIGEEISIPQSFTDVIKLLPSKVGETNGPAHAYVSPHVVTSNVLWILYFKKSAPIAVVATGSQKSCRGALRATCLCLSAAFSQRERPPD